MRQRHHLVYGPSGPAIGESNRSEPAERCGFVGRERELGELGAALDDAAAGRGSLFLISGAAGIGKTALTKQLAEHATSRGARVLSGRCWEDGGAPAYWPWTQVIRAYMRSCDPQVLVSTMAGGAAHIASIVREIPSLSMDENSRARTESDSGRFLLFDAVVTFLKNASTRETLVLIFGELHAADRATLSLLRFLARELAGARILVICTCRTFEAEQQSPAAEALQTLSREARHIVLGKPTSLPEEATFRKDERVWTITYRERTCRLEHSKGLSYLDKLVRHPSNEFHVFDLVREEKVSGDDLENRLSGNTTAVALRRRLLGLRAGLEEAERHNDSGRASGYQEAMSRLMEKAVEAAGLQGRNTEAGAASERARQNIKKAIHSALQKIATQVPQLAHHLATSIRTGTFCSYVPDPRAPIRWKHLGFLFAIFAGDLGLVEVLDFFEMLVSDASPALPD